MTSDFVVFQDQSSSAGALWQLDSLLRRTFLIYCCCCWWYCFCCCGWLYLWHSESCRLVQTPFTLSSETFFNSFRETKTILIQVCVRLYHAKKRMQDPELDNLINPHEVTVKRSYLTIFRLLSFPKISNIRCPFKSWQSLSSSFSLSPASSVPYFRSQVKHWMDPALIPYGWGLFSEGEEVSFCF